MSHHRHARRTRVGIMPFLLLGGAVYALTRPRKTKANDEGGDNREAHDGDANSAARPSGGEANPAAREANNELQRNARKAMRMKDEHDRSAPSIPDSRTAHAGMHNNPNRDIAPSGAVQSAGFRPAQGR